MPSHQSLPIRLSFLLIVLAGCGAGAADESPSQKSQDEQQRSPQVALEYWDAYYIGDAKIGHAHITIAPVMKEGQSLIRIDSDSQLTIKRFNQEVTQKLKLVAHETPEGEIRDFESKLQAGPQTVSTTGEFQDGKLVVVTKSLGKELSSSIDWKPEWGGFFAAEQELRLKPMQPGETRTFTGLMPVFNQPGTFTLTAGEYEETAMLEGKRRLLKIESSVDIGGAKIDSLVWADETGEAVKSFVPGVGQISYRTSKELATGKSEGAADFDLGEVSVVKVPRGLQRPHETRRVVYKAHLPEGDPVKIFPAGPTQSVASIDEHTARVTVTSLRANEPEKIDPADTRPQEADLAPNNLVQSDDEKIVKMAASVLPEEKDPVKIALALEQFVKQSITSKNFSQAFATAAEVAESLEGDCTEHAVLLAALCRARKIPARVAVGLVYYPGSQGFAYHMWTEAWLGDRWLPLDATLGRGGIGAAHLKLTQSNLKGASAYSAFLPVFQVLGRLKLEIEEVDF